MFKESQNLKIACSGCNSKVSLEGQLAFTKVNCPSCQLDIIVPFKIGEFLLFKELRKDTYYASYEGIKAVSGTKVHIKIFEKEKISEKLFKEIESVVLNDFPNTDAPSLNKLNFASREGHFLMWRNWQEISIEEYLKNNDLRLSKAMQITRELTKIIAVNTQKGKLPAAISKGNLLLNESGKVLISDYGFKDAVLTVCENQGLKSFQSTLTVLTRIYAFLYTKKDMSDDSKIKSDDFKFKDKNRPAELESFLNKLQSDAKPLTFEQLEELISSLEKSEECTKEKKPKEAPKPALLKTSNVDKIQRKIRRKTKKRSGPVMAGLLVIAILLMAIAMKFSVTQTREVVDAKPEKKTVKQIKPPKKKPVIIRETKPKINQPVKEAAKMESLPTVVKASKKPEEIRPHLMPEDFNFDHCYDQYEEYIQLLSEPQRQIEKKRLEILVSFRDDIMIPMIRDNYKGNIYLKDKKIFRGIVTEVQDDIAVIHVLKIDKTISVSWPTFQFIQYQDIVAFYSTSLLSDYKLGEDPGEAFIEIAAFYKKLAIVADWYGHSEIAAVSAQRAIEFNPQLEQELSEFFQSVTN